MSKLSIKAVAIATAVGGVVLGASFASAALVLPTQNCSYSFDRNFRMGVTGTDVQNLQKVLNAYPQTRVSETGAGSPGNESTYYGAKTKTAVVKFQNLHADDILTPNGLTVGNGNVYSSTRSVLNQICTGVASNPTTPTTPTTPVTTTGPVSVSLSAGQPQQMIVLGQAGAKLADFTFTGNGTVTNVQFQRIGASSDSVITNVYLYDGNTRITDAASVVTGGLISFNSASGLFTVNGSRTISVRADVGTTATFAGNSVGVKLNSVTTLGGSAATFTNVAGNQLVLANVATAGVNFTSAVTAGTGNPAAGETNYNVWSGAINISTRAVNLKSATFKFVGSAPVDALANISIYIDGTKIGNSSTINAANNNKVTFDFGGSPFVLTTGAHTIDVRGDVVKGSNRTMTFSVENASDLMFEDTGLAGVNISPTIANATFAQSNATGPLITVQTGTVTVNTDPAFVASQVTGGATNVPVGSFVMKAYGEDVKVNSLRVTFATTTITTLANVSLFVNGSQVGSTVAFPGTAALTFGTSNLFTLTAGQSTTVTVKADMISVAGSNYTSGTIATVIGGVASNGQGTNSFENVSVAATAVTGGTLTVSSGAGTFVKASGFTNTTVAPDTQNVKIGSFVLQAGSAESIKVNSAGFNTSVAGNTNAATNYTDITLKTGSTMLGTPRSPTSAGTTTFSFNDIVIPVNGSQTFDVYANVGAAASSTSNPVLTTAMSVTYRGSISNTSTVSSVAGITVTSVAATIAVPTLSTSAALARYVVGGSQFAMASFKLKTSTAGTRATVNQLDFITSGADGVAEISVAGIPFKPINTTGTTTFSGLSIDIDSTGTDVPVTVKYSNFQGTTGCPTCTLAASNIASTITLGNIVGTKTGQTQITGVASNIMTVVASRPTVSVSAGGTNAVTLSSVTETKVGEFTVTADTNGAIAVASTSVSLSVSGLTAGYEITGARIADGNTTIPTATKETSGTSSTTPIFTFVPAYDIPAGTSKTFSVYAKVNGALSGSNAAVVTSSLTSAASFKWVDTLGGSTVLTGTLLHDFPTSGYRTQ